MFTKKIENLFKIRILIFDFKLLLALLSLIIFFGLKYLLSSEIVINKAIKSPNVNLPKIKFDYISKTINIGNINKSFKKLKEKIEVYFNYLRNIRYAINYLPIKTILYVPKVEIKKESKNLKQVENKNKIKENKKNKIIKSIFKRKLTLYIDLYSLVFISKKSDNNLVCIKASTGARYRQQSVCLRQNTCMQLKFKKIEICIDKIYPDKVEIKIKVGDNLWKRVIYPGLNILYLEY